MGYCAALNLECPPAKTEQLYFVLGFTSACGVLYTLYIPLDAMGVVWPGSQNHRVE